MLAKEMKKYGQNRENNIGKRDRETWERIAAEGVIGKAPFSL